ncbi:hypothetical protein HYT18_04585 [Candidatus Microgenomates bacterium]|nr:hypothetical protein [Candidatus Microgenomates bacterium]
MKKKIILLAGAVGLTVIGLILLYLRQQNPLSSPQSNLVKTVKEVKPSQTYIEYTDPSGFSFSYPDNLSISKAEIEDTTTYADLQLFSQDVNGSITIKITDSKFTSLDDWLKENKIPPDNISKEVRLGNLNGLEVRTSDRLLTAALDQGVLFTIELPLIEQDFWMKVYEGILAEFTFVSPDTTASQGTSDSSDVIFEGEEVVE